MSYQNPLPSYMENMHSRGNQESSNEYPGNTSDTQRMIQVHCWNCGQIHVIKYGTPWPRCYTCGVKMAYYEPEPEIECLPICIPLPLCNIL